MKFLFQEKRGDREVEQLFRSLELITEIKEGQVMFISCQCFHPFMKEIRSCDTLKWNEIASLELNESSQQIVDEVGHSNS